jgi:hypothetical protein
VFTIFASLYMISRDIMAEVRLILSRPLCFLLSKVGKVESKCLKSILMEFFDPTEISASKKQLMEDIVCMNLDEKVPHTPMRRDGENRVRLETDDLLSLLNFIDELKKLDSLPTYVTDNPDNMPSIRLFEGDLSYIMNRLERVEGRLDHRLSDISSALAAIIGDIRVINKGLHGAKYLQEWPALVVNTAARPTATGNLAMQANLRVANNKQSDGNPTIASLKNTVSTSCNKDCVNPSSDPISLNQLPMVGNWAVASTPVTKRSLMKLGIPTTSTESDAYQESTDDQSFTHVQSRKKRRRGKSQQEAVTRLYSTAVTAATATSGTSLPKRRGPLIIGKATSLNSTVLGGVKAAKRSKDGFISKKIFCIDNVDSSCSVEDMVNYVSTMSVQVLSCFPAKSRRRRTDIDGEMPDRNAFRLCINSAHCERLLNEHEWPAYVCISEWFFKSSVEQGDVITPINAERQPTTSTTKEPTVEAIHGNTGCDLQLNEENAVVIDMEETILTQDSLETTLTRDNGGS